MENKNSLPKYQQAINKTTKISIITNLILTLIKFSVGLLTLSLALISDGFHSLSDIFTDVVVYTGAKIGSKPPDKDHHFGHEKYETFGGLLLSVLLFFAAFGIIAYGLHSIRSHQIKTFHAEIIVVAILSVGAKEKLFRWTKKLADEHNSQIMLANAWHHRTDSFSSFAVIIGGIFSWFGFFYADAITGIIVGLIITTVAFKLFLEAISELSEISPGKEFEKKVVNILEKNDQIRSFHKLRIRKMGPKLLMDMHILVDPDLSIKKAHEISDKVELEIKKELGANTSIVVHVEPCIKENED